MKKRSHIKIIHVPHHTKQWYDFRLNGYGASETPSVVAADYPKLAQYVYDPPVKVHLDKLEEPILTFQGNPASEEGHCMEPVIIKWYRCLNPVTMDLVDMYRNSRQKKPRYYKKAIRREAFWTNKKYPWLFVSPDAAGYLGRKNTWGIECKNTNDLEANKYPEKLSPSFVIQVQTQLLVTEWEYIDIAMKLDRGKFEVIPFELDVAAKDFIVETTHKYWQNVLKARQIKEEYGIITYFNTNPESFNGRQLEGLALLHSLEPDLVGTQREFEFIDNHFPKEKDITDAQGTQQHIDCLLEYVSASQDAIHADTKRKMALSKLLRSMPPGVNKIFFDDHKKEYFSYLADKNGKVTPHVSHRMKIRLKIDFDI